MTSLDLVVVTHVNQMSSTERAYGPPLALVEHLRKSNWSFAAITHPFAWSSPSPSEIGLTNGGRLVGSAKLPTLVFPETLSYLKDVIATLWFVLTFRLRTSIYIGADGINTLAGIILKRIHLTDAVIYYSIDYTHKRFRSLLLNAAYHALDRFCAQRSDCVWNLSNRMAEVRRKQGIREDRNLVVPVGTNLRNKTLESYDQPHTLVFLSHLVPSKGMDLVLGALSQIAYQIPEVKLIIIGGGPYEDHIKENVRQQNLAEHIVFLGPRNHAQLLDLLPHFAVGLAPYPPLPDSITWYADPTKVKDYLSCGLPVITTRVPEVSEELEKARAGVIIDYSIDELTRAVVTLLSNNDGLMLAKHRALEMARRYTWDDILSTALDSTRKLLSRN